MIKLNFLLFCIIFLLYFYYKLFYKNICNGFIVSSQNNGECLINLNNVFNECCGSGTKSSDELCPNGIPTKCTNNCKNKVDELLLNCPNTSELKDDVIYNSCQNYKITFSDETIDINKYKEAYCNTTSNGLLLSEFLGNKIDGSGSIMRKDFPKLYSSSIAWGLIWDPNNNENAIQCGYNEDMGTLGCNDSNGLDRCNCKTMTGYSKKCYSSDDNCIQTILKYNANKQVDFNEFVISRHLKYTNFEDFENMKMNERPSALFNRVNKGMGNFNILRKYFHKNTYIILINSTEINIIHKNPIQIKDYVNYIKENDYLTYDYVNNINDIMEQYNKSIQTITDIITDINSNKILHETENLNKIQCKKYFMNTDYGDFNKLGNIYGITSTKRFDFNSKIYVAYTRYCNSLDTNNMTIIFIEIFKEMLVDLNFNKEMVKSNNDKLEEDLC